MGAMKQYDRIEKFLNFLKSWYLCYFSPDAARRLQNAAPQAYLDRIGSNINNVAQYMYRENKREFEKILHEIQSKLPGIEKIEPQKFENGQMMLRFYEKGFERPFYSQRIRKQIDSRLPPIIIKKQAVFHTHKNKKYGRSI